MKKLIFLSMAIGLLTLTNSLAQVGIGTNQPDKSAVLDIVSTQRGLLIPRIALTSTTSASPIAGTPANSLMVYNTATVADVVPGFYYWDGAQAKWILIMTVNNVPTTGTTSSVSGIGNIIVTPTTTGNNTDYAVEIGPGLDGQVLVSQMNATTNQLEAVWVDPSTFIANSAVTAGNGLTQTTDVNGDPLIELGGTLDQVTTITTDPTNTLNIAGLEVTDASNKIVVVEDGTGELATVNKMISGSLATSLVVSATNLANYSPYVRQVYLEIDVADLNGADVNLTLPDPVAAIGQVFNVKIVDPGSAGDATNYLNILKYGTTSPSSTNTLSYGAVPFQAWVIKSDGTNWQIVSSK